MDSEHSDYSNPLGHGALLDDLSTDVADLSAVARNVIVHYRASGEQLPDASRNDIDLRWLSAILETDQARHPKPLTEPRPPAARVQGCCRDHSLFCVGALRQHGIAARSLIGFAGYFEPGFHHDHVIVQVRQSDDGWLRFDPEVEQPSAALPTPLDIPAGPDSPFLTAAEVWRGYRSGSLDPSRFGVAPDIPFAGPWFIQNYVLYQIAHRNGDELLLWDGWGAMSEPDKPLGPETLALTDEIADLLIAADSGDRGAEAELTRRYAEDARLHPGTHVQRHSPYGDPPVTERIGPRPGC